MAHLEPTIGSSAVLQLAFATFCGAFKSEGCPRILVHLVVWPRMVQSPGILHMCEAALDFHIQLAKRATLPAFSCSARLSQTMDA